MGLFLFAGTVVFALITLPVEFNASKRALGLLRSYQLADGRELQEAKQVLDAASLTYIAALAQALAQLDTLDIPETAREALATLAGASTHRAR